MCYFRYRVPGFLLAFLVSSFTVRSAESWQLGPPAPAGPAHNGNTCTVYSHGNKIDDTPQILQAFKDCNNGGKVVFPNNQNYWIATKLNPVIYDVTVEWKGTWTVRIHSRNTAEFDFICLLSIERWFWTDTDRNLLQMSDDLDYWRNNSYPITFQNHHAGFVITGERISINGFGTGGILGNGNAWYNEEQKVTRPGRPFPFLFWNVTDVTVQNCRQSHSITPFSVWHSLADI